MNLTLEISLKWELEKFGIGSNGLEKINQRSEYPGLFSNTLSRGDMVKHKLQVRSCEIRVESLKT